MIIKIKSERGAFTTEKSGAIEDWSILAILGYREALNWALDPKNREIVLGHLTSRGDPPLPNYIDFNLFATFCDSVWDRMPPDDPEFMLGFCLGAGDAVKQLGGPSAT